MSSTFTPTLKTLRCDDRGRINVGSVLPDSKGGLYAAAVDPAGRVLLTPQRETATAASDAKTQRAVE